MKFCCISKSTIHTVSYIHPHPVIHALICGYTCVKLNAHHQTLIVGYPLVLSCCIHAQPWHLRKRDKWDWKSLKIGTFLNLNIHYYRQIFTKIGTHGKNCSFSSFFSGSKQEQSLLNRDSWQVCCCSVFLTMAILYPPPNSDGIKTIYCVDWSLEVSQ